MNIEENVWNYWSANVKNKTLSNSNSLTIQLQKLQGEMRKTSSLQKLLIYTKGSQILI